MGRCAPPLPPSLHARTGAQNHARRQPASLTAHASSRLLKHLHAQSVLTCMVMPWHVTTGGHAYSTQPHTRGFGRQDGGGSGGVFVHCARRWLHSHSWKLWRTKHRGVTRAGYDALVMPWRVATGRHVSIMCPVHSHARADLHAKMAAAAGSPPAVRSDGSHLTHRWKPRLAISRNVARADSHVQSVAAGNYLEGYSPSVAREKGR